jgi:predicted SAM-dependent methyltransferase
MKNKIYLNFGAGNPVKKWVNIDSSPFFMAPMVLHYVLFSLGISKRSAAYIDNHYSYFKFTDSTSLPFKNNSVDVIYSSHVQEHFSVNENEHFFYEAHRILNKNGVLRIIVPNLEKNIKLNKAMFSLENELLTLPLELKKNKLRAMLEAFHGFPSFHKTLFVSKYISKKSFKKWRVKNNLKFLESKIDPSYLRLVEIEARTKNALIFELTKK